MNEKSLIRATHRPWFLNPYLLLAYSVLLGSISELLLSHGSTATKPLAVSSGWPGISALASGWEWLGILIYIIAFVCWLQVLRFVPLNIAFALLSVDQVLIALGAWYFLGEAISLHRWCGIIMVLAGIAIIAKPLMKAEERL